MLGRNLEVYECATGLNASNSSRMWEQNINGINSMDSNKYVIFKSL